MAGVTVPDPRLLDVAALGFGDWCDLLAHAFVQGLVSPYTWVAMCWGVALILAQLRIDE